MSADEPAVPMVATDLADLAEIPLSEVAEAVKSDEAGPEETLRRVAPGNGDWLLVAASFNSTI